MNRIAVATLALLSAASSYAPQSLSRSRMAFVLRAGIDGGGLNLDEGKASVLDTVVSKPDAPAARSCGGTVMVSGLLKSKERTDQTTFDFLKENPLFEWSKVIAYCNDATFAKKRLTSRSARYSGLLDLLEFKEAASPDAVPSPDDLAGVTSLVAYGVTADEVKEIASNAAAAGVKNLVALMENPTDAKAVKAAADSLGKASGVSFTLVTVPKIVDGTEGTSAYRVGDALASGALSGAPDMPRDEALRLMTECLALDAACGKSLSFETVAANDAAADYLKDLRGKGYGRSQEVEKMISGGVAEYEAALGERKAEEEAVAKETEVKKEKISKSREQEIKELMAKGKREYLEMMEKRVETEALEILKREWREKYFARNTSLPEEEYVAENMERGKKEAIRMIKMLKGEKIDEDEEEEHWMDREEREEAEAAANEPDPEPVAAAGGDKAE